MSQEIKISSNYDRGLHGGDNQNEVQELIKKVGFILDRWAVNGGYVKADLTELCSSDDVLKGGVLIRTLVVWNRSSVRQLTTQNLGG